MEAHDVLELVRLALRNEANLERQLADREDQLHRRPPWRRLAEDLATELRSAAPDSKALAAWDREIHPPRMWTVFDVPGHHIEWVPDEEPS